MRVRNNRFVATSAFAASCAVRCNRNAAIATAASASVSVRLTDGTIGTRPNPAPPTWAQAAVALPSVNPFTGNTYVGSWRFNAGTTATTLGLAEWRAAGQDR